MNTLTVPTIRGVQPALWCFAGATTHAAAGIVVLRDGRAARPYARASRVVQQALVTLRPGDLVVTVDADRDADGPTVARVVRVGGAWVEKRRADGDIDALVPVERVAPSTVEAWLASDEGARFWAACRRYHNRVWPL